MLSYAVADYNWQLILRYADQLIFQHADYYYIDRRDNVWSATEAASEEKFLNLNSEFWHF